MFSNILLYYNNVQKWLNLTEYCKTFLYKELMMEQGDTENTITFFVPIRCNI